MEKIIYPIPNQNYMVLVRCFTFNHSHYIEDALNGFAMQQTSFPFICLVVDDASTDGEQEVIRKWMERECDMSEAETIDIPTSIVILVPHKVNKFCSFAFYLFKHNLHGTGKKKMNHVYPWRDKCKYEALCEGDDFWIDPLKLQMQVDFMEANSDYSMCFHNAVVLNERVETKERIKNFCQFKCDQQISTKQIIEDWCIPTASLLYRKKHHQKLELPRFFSGDYTLELGLASIGKVYYIDRYMSVYRLNNGGVSSKISVKKWANQLFGLLEWYDKYTSNRYHYEIQSRIREVKRNTRYIALKEKHLLLPIICMPKYTLKMLREKLGV